MTYCKVERLIGKRTLSIEVGKIAKSFGWRRISLTWRYNASGHGSTAPEEKE